MMDDRPFRELSDRVAGPGRQVYVAGVLALTEPGPAAAGLVVADSRDRVLAHRAHYLGRANRAEATAQALLGALRLAASGLASPTFRLDDAPLADFLSSSQPLPPEYGQLEESLRAARDELRQFQVELITPSANLARPVALAPLVEWLPERTRRADELRVQQVGPNRYQVASQTDPEQVYQITLPAPGGPHNAGAMQCECPDFAYRGIPCKHLLAVAREAGVLDRLFYPDDAPSRR